MNFAQGTNPETDALTWGTGCQARFTQANTAVQQVTFDAQGHIFACVPR